MNILYIIPARSGSKGLPGKNIKLLNAKPLIYYSIKVAKESKYQGKVIVSTDDQKIAEISKECGADVPYLRPLELSTDQSSSIDVILHAIEFFKQQNVYYDTVVLFQPTSPLRLLEDINIAFDLFIKKNAEAVVSVCENDHHPYWSNTLPESGSMKDFIRPEIKGLNRQQLPKSYRLNGAIYISTVEALVANKGFIHSGTYASVMPNERSVDIDHEIDFDLAESCFI